MFFDYIGSIKKQPNQLKIRLILKEYDTTESNLSFLTLNICKVVMRDDCPGLAMLQFKRLMHE